MKKLATISIIALLTLTACGESNEGVNENSAKALCRTLVEQELTDPSNSEFQNAYDVMAWPIDGGYRIHGEVSVANAFGGLAPYVYECKVTLPEGAEDPEIILEALNPQ